MLKEVKKGLQSPQHSNLQCFLRNESMELKERKWCVTTYGNNVPSYLAIQNTTILWTTKGLGRFRKQCDCL
jgi:hypothetical protein